MGKKSGLLFLIFLFGLQYLFAQSTTGSIEGWILDNNNKPVTAANIYVISSALLGSRGDAADKNGYFRIRALPVGTYSIEISHISFQKITIKDIRVLLGQTTSIGAINLKEGAIETKELIISGNRPFIDSRSTTNGKSLPAQQFDKLPIERDYLRLAELLPGADISYKGDRGTNFSGGTGLENLYFLDGAEVSNIVNGGPLFDIPYNFVREVEIRSGGYQAEYQSSLGGVINTVTYTGGNEFHATFFGYLTNNSLRGQPRLDQGQLPEGNYYNSDIGFGAGGPIIKDRLWYYVAYDPNFNSREVFLNGMGMQNTYKAEHKFAGKLTWGVNKDNLLTFALYGNMYNANEISIPPSLIKYNVLNLETVAMNDKGTDIISIAKGIHTLSDIIMIESSLSLGMIRRNVKPTYTGNNDFIYVDRISGTVSGGFGNTRFNPQLSMYSGSVKGILSLPAHSIKAGFEYTLNSTTRDEDLLIKERSINKGQIYFLLKDALSIGTVKEKNFSAFIQDTWQISRRLCLNAGLRWDPQWFVASDGSMAQKITDQVQPRLGIIYQPGKIGTQKITASFGRFYQPVQLALPKAYHLENAYYYYIAYPNDPQIDTSGANFLGNLTPFVKNIDNLKGQYEDEYSLGYERLISSEFKLGVRGVYRRLGQGIEDGFPSLEYQEIYPLQVYGNPGSGMLSMLPKLKREYTALEFTFERFASDGFNFLASYVLSRNYGNYDGLAETYDGTINSPNATNQFGIPLRMINSIGLLPNDRTHVFKFAGSYVFDFGLSAGVIFQWMSGTPLNDFGLEPDYWASIFLQPRGSVGRTPSLWDLNFRFIYDLSNLIRIGPSAKLVLDLMHVASQKTVIDYDQYRYMDPGQNIPNPNFMKAIQFMPPMMIRMGLEVNI